MKSKKKLITILAFALILSVIPVVPASAKARINVKSKVLYSGQTVKLKVKGTKKKVKWSSTNKKVATVTQKGKVKAKQVGVATIKAKIIGKTFKCRIEVIQNVVDNSNSNEDTNNIPNTEPNTEPSGTEEPEEDLTGKVEILKEYTFSDSTSWYTRRFMVVKNNSQTTVEISTSSIAYSKEDLMVSVATSSLDALGAGCISIFYEAFETNAEIDHYKTEMKVVKSENYRSVIQDLSYTQNSIEDGVIFEVKNDGEEPAQFVEGYALFFLGDELVDWDSTYFDDDDYELKPGATIFKQLNSYKDFDRVEFYLTGRR